MSLMMLQVLVPITRKWRVIDLAKEIDEMDFLTQEVEVLVVVDNSQLKKATVVNAFKFDNPKIKSVRVVRFRNGQPVEGNIFERRRRIAKMLNFAKTQLNKKYELTLIIEDDTVVKKDDFKKLFYDWQILKKQGVNIGAVSGLQAGRWASKIIGAWIVDDVEKPKHLKSIDFTTKEVLKRVDATGLYFLLTETESLKKHEFAGHDLAPDVNYGLYLRQMGKEIVVDWTVKLDHVSRDKIYQVDENCESLIFVKNPKGLWKVLEK